MDGMYAMPSEIQKARCQSEKGRGAERANRAERKKLREKDERTHKIYKLKSDTGCDHGTEPP